MIKILCFVFTMILMVYSQSTMFDQALSPRLANYEIEVKLDPDEKKLYGKETITWRNKSGDFISDLQFHLYLNAFKNSQSTFMIESGGRHRSSQLEINGGWGWIQVKHISLEGGIDLTDSARYIQPDDGNEMDETVMQILLPKSIQPYETIKIYIEFEARLPQVFARTGYKDNFFMVGQWFPKIGVYEEAGDRYATQGQWNCHQFHSNSEFYADFGVYDVSITVPIDYIVGATGIKIGDQINDDSTKTLNYYCEDVHDFAWTADRNYIVIEDQWKHVKIKYLVHPFHDHAAKRHIMAAKNALEYLNEWFGTYPYPTLTIVDPQYGARGAGGMEYPTLITAGMFWLIPEGLKYPELVTVHEFGHNYFYGLLASNEFEEAWLDEGITSYVEMKMMEKYYSSDGGSAINLFGVQVQNDEMRSIFFRKNAKQDAIFKFSWDYPRGGYGTFSYTKPALMMLTLENHLGQGMMKKITRTYFENYKFKHPTTQDFIETVNEVTGEDYNWFFDQVIYGTGDLDYKLERIINKNARKRFSGIYGDPTIVKDSSQVSQSVDDTIGALYKSEVWVSREGEVKFPVEILVKFADGDEILEKWDGQSRYKIFKYDKNTRIISAEVDPDKKLSLETNLLNNGLTIKKFSAPKLKYNLRWLFWAQNILHAFAVFS